VRKLDWIEETWIVDPEKDTLLMEETAMVEPVSDWKYPVMVESVGTLTEDRTVREEVTWMS
jgi:hypothetical protein